MNDDKSTSDGIGQPSIHTKERSEYLLRRHTARWFLSNLEKMQFQAVYFTRHIREMKIRRRVKSPVLCEKNHYGCWDNSGDSTWLRGCLDSGAPLSNL